MDRNTRARSLASAMVVTALLAKATAATADVVLPCPAFKPGNSWQSIMTTPMGPTIISTTVLSTDGQKILVGEKTTSKITIPGMPGSGSEMTNSVQAEYENHGSDIVRNSVSINGMRSVSEPPERICGTLPSQWTVTTKIVMTGMTTLTQATLTARSLGKEKITVPAGTFDATVVEIRRKEQSGAVSAPDMSAGDHVHVIYAVENVGFIKMVVNDAARNKLVTELQSFVIR